jgi:predicted outer membrane repeat protein
VALQGGYAGDGAINPDMRDPNRYPTILSGDLLGDDLQGTLNRDDNSYHVVTARGLLPPPRLDGFTIQSGQADGTDPNQFGGGLYVTAGSPEVLNCTFRSNTAVFGGAIAAVHAAPVLGNCKLTGNQALLFGGALYNEDGAVVLTNGLIVGNSAGQAAALGSSALYNVGGSITLNDCTVADNAAPKGMAITSLVWGSPALGQIMATNSILHNGGDEIFSTDPCAVVVAYSDVQGGWSGIGNLNADPHFVNPGRWSIGGDWIDGDYRLMSDSSCIDQGDKTRLPVDTLDLDGNGNASEALPVDLNGNPRVLGLQVDMGAYEQLGSGPGPGPGWVALVAADLTYDVPANPPTFPINVSGSSQNTVQLNFKAELRIDVAAASVAGGVWTASFNPDPNPVGPGTVTFNYTIHGVGLEVWRLPANTPNVTVATVTISVRPAP